MLFLFYFLNKYFPIDSPADPSYLNIIFVEEKKFFVYFIPFAQIDHYVLCKFLSIFFSNFYYLDTRFFIIAKTLKGTLNIITSKWYQKKHGTVRNKRQGRLWRLYLRMLVLECLFRLYNSTALHCIALWVHDL